MSGGLKCSAQQSGRNSRAMSAVRGGNLPGRSGDFTGEPIVLAREGVIRAWNTQALALQATAAANPGVRLFAGDALTLEQTRELFNNGLISPNGKLAFFNRTQKGQKYGHGHDQPAKGISSQHSQPNQQAGQHRRARDLISVQVEDR